MLHLKHYTINKYYNFGGSKNDKKTLFQNVQLREPATAFNDDFLQSLQRFFRFFSANLSTNHSLNDFSQWS